LRTEQLRHEEPVSITVTTLRVRNLDEAVGLLPVGVNAAIPQLKRALGDVAEVLLTSFGSDHDVLGQ